MDMDIKMGRHYFVDLYLCQKNLWEDITQLASEIAETFTVNKFDLVQSSKRPIVLINNELEAALVIIQIFPEYKFLSLDFFSWNSEIDLGRYSENLIELFAPQVVASETRFRAEHLN
jgi:S-adenosylmethionine/arginine decarboxylase-like enzyme